MQERTVSPTLERLLEEIERRACLYFWEQAHPNTGLILDRARCEGRESRTVASIAATGFGLSALCIADQRGYLDRSGLRYRAEQTLEYLARWATQKRGFYFHFLDCVTGERAWQSEFSSIDTAWLLCGVMHARAHFDSPRVCQYATEILQRVDWRWMLNGNETLCHGWTPEGGFLPYRWDSYSELMAMYLLAVGSPSHGISSICWDAWQRPVQSCEGLTYIGSSAPLFIHQYSHAWFDFRGRRDRYTDYFQNSQHATEAHRLLCLSKTAEYPWYNDDLWGVTAADSLRGYHVVDSRVVDGRLVPCAAGGSVAFLPAECGTVLETMLNRYGAKVWGRYGFTDAFQPNDGWFSADVIGIDLGIMLLMAENARTGSVWEAIMSAPEAARGMDLVGLVRS